MSNYDEAREKKEQRYGLDKKHINLKAQREESARLYKEGVMVDYGWSEKRERENGFTDECEICGEMYIFWNTNDSRICNKCVPEVIHRNALDL